MTQPRHTFVLFTLPVAILETLAFITIAQAQITPDSTLGAESSIVNQNVIINGTPSDRIDGGATRGSSLFHSFQEFNVGEGRGAYFSNPANITNILTRVTGGNPSNILGKLGVLGNANLFLLNPKGIFFGRNASLDLRGGSFFGTTADSFIFNDNFEFSTTNPQAVPLLSVNIPIGLRFRDNPGTIASQSTVLDTNNNLVGLQVQPGNSLALVGGNINLSDGGRLTATGGSIELGGLATAGTVGLDVTGNSFKLNFPTNGLLSDITISNARVQNVVFSGTTGTAGDIKITANNLSVTNGGTISATTFGTGDAGRVFINATGDISIVGENTIGTSSAIFNQVGSLAQGNSGGIEIKTNNLYLNDGGIIDASTFGRGDAGKVIISATGNISASGEDNGGLRSGIYSQVNPTGQGDAGGIQIINTKDVSLTNGGRISANTLGMGNAGSVIINATGNISAQGESKKGSQSGIFSQVGENAQGNSDGIEINTNNLSLKDGGTISATTFTTVGTGNAGRVIINATGDISAQGESKDGFLSGIFSRVAENAQGSSGGIEIKTNNLFLSDGGRINASTLGNGNAGSVIINATGNISAQGESKKGSQSGIFSQVGENAQGNSGGIEIKTNNLSLKDGGTISATTFTTVGTGNAGRVIINATGDISAQGESKDGFLSGIFSRVAENAQGSSGGIEIKTNNLFLSDGGRINASTLGNGNAGSVIINATGNISAQGESKEGSQSGIFSQVGENAQGNSGGIEIKTNNLSLKDGGTISGSTFGKGNAGRVIINATGNISAQGESKEGSQSGIFSRVNENAQGNSGGIRIDTKNLSVNDGGVISASTFGTGDAGKIIINATGDISLVGGNSSGAIFSQVAENAQGNSGGIEINTNNLSLTNGGQINASTLGQGDAGSLIINATGNISASGQRNQEFQSRIVSAVEPSGVGNAGGIKINARSLSLSNNAILSANSEGTGAAGNIEVTTAKDIRLDNRASITATTKGDQGNIFLNSRDLILRRNSNITTNATGTATGGNINIVTGNFVALENSDITANAQKGFGGDIFIKAAYRFASPDSDITAASDLGTDFSGTVQINNTDVNPSQGLMQLPDNPTDPSNQIAQNPCQKGFGSTFIITGRGGLPSNPNDSLTNDNARVDLAQPASNSSSQAVTINQPKNSATTKEIVPARGWIFNEKGEVVLTAYDVNSREFQRQYLRQNSAGCKVF